jgi:tetratricopeptide (TPR) repeat protein
MFPTGKPLVSAFLWLIRRKPLWFGLTLVLTALPAWAKLNVAVLRPHLAYPSQQAPWVEPFLQHELTRQLQLSGQFAVMPPDVVEQWQLNRPNQSDTELLSAMEAEVGISLSIQKVLGRAQLRWRLLQRNGEDWTEEDWEQTIRWEDSEEVVFSLLQGLGRSPIFAELPPYPNRYDWAALERFFSWRQSAMLADLSSVDSLLQELDDLERTFPELAQWGAYHRAMLLVLKGTLRRPAHVPTLREAATALEPALELQPGASHYHTLNALIFFLQGEQPLAKSEAVQANADNPRMGPALILYGLTIGRQPQDGQSYIVSGLERYPFLREASPQRFPPYQVLAPDLERWLLPQVEEAEQEDYSTLMTEGEAQYRSGEWTRAERLFKRAQQADPQRPEPTVGLARLRLAQDDPAGSLAILNPLRKRFPKHPHVLLYYGYTLEQAGQLDDAEEAYRSALGNTPDNSRALLRLGTVLIKRGRLEEAKSFLESLTRKYPSYTVAWWNLGIAYHKLGQLKLAEQAWEQALVLEPDNLKIQQTLNQLQRDLRLNR